ncbi:hypothetical protein ALC56_04322 [Trachymyrmex septentrionalis]|uniref:Uncharacterized protein n=1 Tax=Trachymyrmex septentrionalis TaxID=34720 RepID=A0A195FLF5_9HYME|nr:hypothetical protein ALC56_04322 [Trachymyrmex septentrionalis]
MNKRETVEIVSSRQCGAVIRRKKLRISWLFPTLRARYERSYVGPTGKNEELRYFLHTLTGLKAGFPAYAVPKQQFADGTYGGGYCGGVTLPSPQFRRVLAIRPVEASLFRVSRIFLNFPSIYFRLYQYIRTLAKQDPLFHKLSPNKEDFAKQGSNEDCEISREFQRHRGLIERTRIAELELASRIVFSSSAASSFLLHGNNAARLPSLAIPSYEIRVSARKLLLAVAARRSYCLARSSARTCCFSAATLHPHFLGCCLKAYSPLILTMIPKKL